MDGEFVIHSENHRGIQDLRMAARPLGYQNLARAPEECLLAGPLQRNITARTIYRNSYLLVALIFSRR